MRGKRVVAVILCAAMVSSSTGMMSMASTSQNGEQMTAMSQKEESSETGQKSKYLKGMGRVASSSEPDKPASPSDATYYVSDEDELREAVSRSGKIVLENEISLTKPLTISKNVEISLEGESITFAGNNTGSEWQRRINIVDGASVTLHNIIIDATGMDYDKKYNDSDNWVDYYAVGVASNAKITLTEGAEIIAADNEDALINPNKRGMWIAGDCLMEDGNISGFVESGIVVSGTFRMTGGIITQNGRGTENWGGTGGLVIAGKRSDEEEGHAYVEGGSIIGNLIGVFNSGHFEMKGGEITENKQGLINNNRDNMTGEIFYPVADLGGGEIVDNDMYAIWNRFGGIVNTKDGIEIGGQQRDDSKLRSMASRASQSKIVIRNADQSTLNIEGGTITAYAPNEIAVFNDSTSTLKMTDGEIVAAGENSVAIQNTNTKGEDVEISGGTLTTTGEGSRLLDNQGYINFDQDKVELGGNASGKYLILAFHNEGGSVTLSPEIVAGDDTIHINITPDDGYRISEVALDGEPKDTVSSLDLPVTGNRNHNVVVTFEKTQSSGSGGSSSSGGSGSGSSRSSAVSSAKTIPETTGSWVQDQTGWKLLNTTGSAYVNTWVRKNSQWYWIGEDGYMKTDWNLISEKWYYLTPVSGEMKTGWIADGVNWYYADETGARVTGWVKTGEKWYYLNADGKMAFSTTTPDGYKVDENGAMV